MQLTFEAVSEARSGPKWQALFNCCWPAFRAWLTRRSGPEQPSPQPMRLSMRSWRAGPIQIA